MAEDSALDDFLTGAASEGITSQGNGQSEQNMLARPKLKKIKRAKVRPTMDIPLAPEKIIAPQADFTQTVSNSVSIENNIIEESISSSDSIVEENTSVGEDTASTSLITATTAQNLSTTSNENSYMLNELPPELDYAMDDDIEEGYVDTSNYVKKNAVYMVAFVFLFIGLVVGKIFFSEQKIENRGLEGIVTNPDTPSGRPRCGLTDKNQACIFYILNWYKQELNGRDFYKLAAQLTGREEYMIESENMHYANVKIKPGYFAQLNIPALK